VDVRAKSGTANQTGKIKISFPLNEIITTIGKNRGKYYAGGRGKGKKTREKRKRRRKRKNQRGRAGIRATSKKPPNKLVKGQR